MTRLNLDATNVTLGYLRRLVAGLVAPLDLYVPARILTDLIQEMPPNVLT